MRKDEIQIKFRLAKDCEVFAAAEKLGITPTALTKLVVSTAIKSGYLKRLVEQEITT